MNIYWNIKIEKHSAHVYLHTLGTFVWIDVLPKLNRIKSIVCQSKPQISILNRFNDSLFDSY